MAFEAEIGDKLDVLGPLGSGFSLPPPNAEVLVVEAGLVRPAVPISIRAYRYN